MIDLFDLIPFMKKKVFLSLIVILALATATVFTLTQITYSDGVRSGRLVKLSKKGVFLPTYEGTLDLGSGDMLTWNFSVHDSELAERLVKLSGNMVQLEYRELFFALYFDTAYDVIKFSPVKESLDEGWFCRLVNLMQKNHHVVNSVREMMNKYDKELLAKVRTCQ